MSLRDGTLESMKTSHLNCSFCGRGKDEVRQLIAGPSVFICDECVEICNEILKGDGVVPDTDEVYVEQHLARARSDLSAARTLIDGGYDRAAVDVARNGARAALRAFCRKRRQHRPARNDFTLLLSLALQANEGLRRLHDLNLTGLITQYQFDGDVGETEARQAVETAEAIVDFVVFHPPATQLQQAPERSPR